MYNILLVEDSADSQILVNHALGSEFQIAFAGTIAEARNQMSNSSFDLILLDVGLPDGSGFDFCSEIQSYAESQRVPVALLTGRDDSQDKTLGWSLGADDYITKPFHHAEFQIRISSRIKKHRARQQNLDLLHYRCFRLNLTFHEASIVRLDGQETRLKLTPHEFKILTFFIRSKEHVLTRRQIMEAVWGQETHITERTVDKHISSLRQKLDEKSDYIRTISGVGYRFGTST